jgi:hypothetical protein
MITKKSIKSYVDGLSSVTREVFSSAVNSTSETTAKHLDSSLDKYKECLIKQGVKVVPTRNWLKVLAEQYDIDEIMVILEVQSRNVGIGSKLTYAVFGKALIAGLGYICDLDLNKLSKAELSEAIDGLALAAIYKNL